MDRSSARRAWAHARTRGLTAAAGHGAGRGMAQAAAIAALALLAFGGGNASALIKRLPNGHRISFQPVHGPLAQAPLTSSAVRTAKTGAPLEYHGGPMMTSNTNYAFYWAPSGSPAYRRATRPVSTATSKISPHDSGSNQNVDSVSAQYTNGSGETAAYKSHFAGAIIDTNPYPKNGCSAAETV